MNKKKAGKKPRTAKKKQAKKKSFYDALSKEEPKEIIDEYITSLRKEAEPLIKKQTSKGEASINLFLKNYFEKNRSINFKKEEDIIGFYYSLTPESKVEVNHLFNLIFGESFEKIAFERFSISSKNDEFAA